MAHHTQSGKLSVIGLLLVSCSPSIGYAQQSPLLCTAAAVPTLVRTEALTERIGDILLLCSGGTAGAIVSGNLNVFLPVSLANRVDADSLATDTALAVDAGGPNISVPGRVTGRSISFNGVQFTIPASGQVALRISNLRANANQLGLDAQLPVQAFITSTLSSVALTNNPVTVARTTRGLLAGSATGAIPCTGSPLPSNINMTSLFAAGTGFASARLTEGFASAFETKTAVTDSGTRFVVRYSGIPAGAHLFVPDVIAGSSAVMPTAGGDLGLTQSGGQYAPSAGGSLLLSRVLGTDDNGAGGQPVYLPGAPGSGVVSLDAASEVVAQGGNATLVYEVVDANPLIQETAQFPTFVAMARVDANMAIQQTRSLGPVSTQPEASTSAPIPRFSAAEPPADCNTLGDCGADYFPRLSVSANPLQFSAVSGRAASGLAGYIAVRNDGGGIMPWTATVTYKSGSGWLTMDVGSGVNTRGFQVFASARNLTPGSYEATITIDASPLSGLVNLPVKMTVSAAPSTPPAGEPPTTPATPGAQPRPVNVTGIANSANFVFAAIAPGSQATVMGSNLAGNGVSVAFDGIAARLLDTSDTQIRLLVPGELGAKSSALMVVTVDGVSSSPSVVALAPVAPAIFVGRIGNEDHSVNGPASPAAPGSLLEVFTTGLGSVSEGVTVKIHDRDNLVPAFFGPAEEGNGVQVVRVAVPDGLPAMLTDMLVCAPAADNQPACSYPAQIAIGTAAQ